MSKFTSTILKEKLKWPHFELSKEDVATVKTHLKKANIDLDFEQFIHDLNSMGDETTALQTEALNASEEQKEILTNRIIELQQNIFKNFKKIGPEFDKEPALQKAFPHLQKEFHSEIDAMISTLVVVKTLVSFEFKADRFAKNNQPEAAKAVQVLLDKLEQELNKTVSTFKSSKEYKQVINEARPELEKHRDANYILANVGIALITMGIGYLIAIVINKAATGNFLFFSKTDSAAKLDNLEEHFDSITAATA